MENIKTILINQTDTGYMTFILGDKFHDEKVHNTLLSCLEYVTEELSKLNKPIKYYTNKAGSKFKLENDILWAASKDSDVWWPTGWIIEEITQKLVSGELKEIK